MVDMEPSDFHWHNKAAWDRLARSGDRLARPARDIDFADPLASVDGPGWLGGNISGQRVLCLAAGGGRQGPIYAAAGGIVTVVDISPAMLELDRRVAAQRGLKLETVEASMDDLRCLDDQSFDLVIHPVSTCYVPDIGAVYQEVARVTKPGGLYISQHKQPTSLQASVQTQNGAYQIRFGYYRDQPLPTNEAPNLIREQGTLEYIHRWEQLIGVMCQAGFVVEALTEPCHAKPQAAVDQFAHRCQFLAPYVRIKARRTGDGSDRQIIF